MDTHIILPMINNAALLLTLSIVLEISIIFQNRLKKIAPILSGILIGVIGIAIMSVPFRLAPGLFFDTRSILICVAALIFGLVPATIAASITIVYRIFIGGIGTVTGCAIILTALLIGLLCRRLVKLDKSMARWLKLYIIGIVVHLAMLACMLLLPWETALPTLREISVTVMLTYPLGVVILALLLLHQVEYNNALTHLAEADSQYKSLFHNNHAAMLIIDPDTGQIVDANPAAAAFYGWTEDELKTMNITRINNRPTDAVKLTMAKTKANERNYHVFSHTLASGDTVDVEVYSGPINIKGRILLYSIIHDISSRKVALNALKESEERFRALVDNAPDAIFVLADKLFTYSNRAGLTLLGAQCEADIIGMAGSDIISIKDFSEIHQYMQALRAGIITPSSVERVYKRLDGTTVNVEVVVVPIKHDGQDADLVFARDITERICMKKKEQEMEAQLRQQQKLEAIGTLAGGVAHEINNPINGIMNYAQLIYDKSDEQSGSAIYAREIIHETERISVIVKNLLQFSRHEKQSHSYASIYDIVGQTISLVNTVIKKDQIMLDIKLDDNLPDIKCRSQQIQQVIMNLLTNARDALNEKYSGYDENKIIRMRCSEYERNNRRWICLSVTDFGNGVMTETRDRIFEPFFSTKPKELGTGLGLSISYGIVSEHHGKITFESEPLKYTKFILDLPVDNGWTL